MTTRRHLVRTLRASPAAERLYRRLEWFPPTLEKFPRSQRALLGDRIEHTVLDLLEVLIRRLRPAGAGDRQVRWQ